MCIYINLADTMMDTHVLPDPDPPAIPTTIGLVADMKPVRCPLQSSHNHHTQGEARERQRESTAAVVLCRNVCNYRR